MNPVKIFFPALTGAFLVIVWFTAAAFAAGCQPTEPDMLGPFYKPDAPVRSSVGEGYELQGTIKSAPACTLVPLARIEFWLAGPDGEYNDEHRATPFSDAEGSYRFTSNLPQPYSGRPPHIHIRVSAEGFSTLITQHYPQPGKTSASFDIVLSPVR
jgi:protocatechuate 3,4-dioxygenase beta subunit